jgi:hypothetical protein
MLDFLTQFFGMSMLLIGLWLMGSKRLIGPFLCFLAEGLTTYVGIHHHVWSMTGIGIVLFFVQLRNFIKWKREGISW